MFLIQYFLGHYARVLVDIDLDAPLRYQVRVERDDFAFFTPIEYERIPEFCNHCKTIGHNILSCRHLSKEDPMIFILSLKVKWILVNKNKSMFLSKM